MFHSDTALVMIGIISLLSISRVQAFSLLPTHVSAPYSTNYRNFQQWSTTSLSAQSQASSKTKLVHIEAIASAGLTNEELPIILSAVNAATDEFGIEFVTDNFKGSCDPAIAIPGATGRVLLLSLNNIKVADDWTDDDERLDVFKTSISQQIDALVGHQIEQPVLVSVKPTYKSKRGTLISQVLSGIVQNEVKTYGLRDPMVSEEEAESATNEARMSPAIHVEIDGAMVPDPSTKEENWDTSTILVFDDFVDSSLRERLLDVILKRDESYSWDDKKGPDPKRWERGGLADTPGDEAEGAACWGLTEDAINELCFDKHAAIVEVEKKISDLFYPEFDVSRLPEAVFGQCVSPLTANAPTYGDSFSYHIDADPNQTPPCE